MGSDTVNWEENIINIPMNKTKSFTQISGTCNGFYYSINVLINRDGSFYQRYGICFKNLRSEYLKNRENIIKQVKEWRKINGRKGKSITLYSENFEGGSWNIRARITDRGTFEHRSNIGASHTEYNKKYYIDHRETCIASTKKWREENKERSNQIINKSWHKRQRELGFEPINKKFEGSVAHHLNQKDVMYIPESLHKSIHHALKNPDSMERINNVAWKWFKLNSSMVA